MKKLALLLLPLVALALPSCITPVIATYANPPGVFLRLPPLPIEVGGQVAMIARSNEREFQRQAAILREQNRAAGFPVGTRKGLRAALRGE